MKPHITSLPMRQIYESLNRESLYLGNGTIDMLHIDATDIIENRDNKYFWIDEVRSPVYRCGARYYCPTSKVYFTLLWDRRYLNMKYPFQIQVNPSHFIDYLEFKNFIYTLIGKQYSINHIRRIDYAVTFDVDAYPAEFFYYVVHFKWKKCSSEYPINKVDRMNGRIISFSIGKSPFRLNCYTRGSSSRLEVQVRRHPSTVRLMPASIERLPTILSFNPFDRINFKHAYEAPKSITSPQNKRLQQLREEKFRRGLQGARSILNVNRNFQRDFNKYLKEVTVAELELPLSRIVLASFRNDVERWLLPGRQPLFESSLNENREKFI